MDINLDINGDLVLTEDGDVETVEDWDEAKQSILRWIFTNPRETLADGTKVLPDYYFDPDFGLGVKKLIGQPFGEDFQAKFLQKVRTAVAQQEGVDTSRDPSVEYFQYGRAIYARIGVPIRGNTEYLNFQVK